MIHRICVALLAAALIGSLAMARDEPSPDSPKSPAATATLKKFEIASGKARKEYERAMNAASKQAVTELDSALKIAMKQGDLEESQRIDAAASQIKQGEFDPSTTITGTFHVVFTSGIDRIMQFNRNGSVNWQENGARKEPGKMISSGGDLLLQLEPGKIERVGVSGNRIYIEHFNPAGRYPKEFATAIGVGYPVQ